jgi:hypothetical protein
MPRNAAIERHDAESPATDPNMYRPRKAWPLGIVACGDVKVKLSAIAATDVPIGNEAIEAAKTLIAAPENLPKGLRHQGAGFAILHQGEEAVWLLLHFWIEGGIATHRLWRADIGRDPAFSSADPALMACVWEFGVIDFERRCWMKTVMNGKSVDDYLHDQFPEGTV